jgi:dihydroflavonol-4-reductase
MITAVTGATGHIGANLIRTLLKEKRQVRALIHNNRRGTEGLDIEIFQADICDPASLERAFTGVEVVYHLAATISLSMNDWPSVEPINVIGTRNVVEACLKCGVQRLVHFSSIHSMVQVPLNVPVNEHQPLVDGYNCPPYDRSKAAGEIEVRKGIEQGLDAVILNPTAILGPHDYQLSFLGEVLLSLAQGKLPALIEGGFDWVDVRDVVNAAIRAEKDAPLGAKYLLSGKWAPVKELAVITNSIWGTPVPRLVLPSWLARTGAPVMTLYNQLTGNRQLYSSVSIKALCECNKQISHERASRELGYKPRPLRDTLVDTFRWFQAVGLLEPNDTNDKKATKNE